jgi:asparagine synthetase B (glutamine-hydrolysing)
MTGVMLVKQRVTSIDRWKAVFRDPELDAVRRRHGLVVTGTYVDGTDSNVVIVVMDMENFTAAQQFATSPELAAARERAGAIGAPHGVWFGPQQIDG